MRRPLLPCTQSPGWLAHEQPPLLNFDNECPGACTPIPPLPPPSTPQRAIANSPPGPSSRNRRTPIACSWPRSSTRTVKLRPTGNSAEYCASGGAAGTSSPPWLARRWEVEDILALAAMSHALERGFDEGNGRGIHLGDTNPWLGQLVLLASPQLADSRQQLRRAFPGETLRSGPLAFHLLPGDRSPPLCPLAPPPLFLRRFCQVWPSN